MPTKYGEYVYSEVLVPSTPYHDSTMKAERSQIRLRSPHSVNPPWIFHLRHVHDRIHINAGCLPLRRMPYIGNICVLASGDAWGGVEGRVVLWAWKPIREQGHGHGAHRTVYIYSLHACCSACLFDCDLISRGEFFSAPRRRLYSPDDAEYRGFLS
jgi:hypothetical protein